MKRRLLNLGTALAVGAASSSLAAAAAPTPEALVPCPFTAAEIQEALGVVAEPGEWADMSFPDGREVGCIYPIKNSFTVLSVRQTWDAAKSAPSPLGAPDRTVEPIPGDPDGAKWEHGPDQRHDLALSYSRGHVQTRIAAYGGTFRNSDFQPKLLKLKRVP